MKFKHRTFLIIEPETPTEHTLLKDKESLYSNETETEFANIYFEKILTKGSFDDTVKIKLEEDRQKEQEDLPFEEEESKLKQSNNSS
jgi:hypothetical protein